MSVHLVDPEKKVELGGVGEPGVPPIAPALAMLSMPRQANAYAAFRLAISWRKGFDRKFKVVGAVLHRDARFLNRGV